MGTWIFFHHAGRASSHDAGWQEQNFEKDEHDQECQGVHGGAGLNDEDEVVEMVSPRGTRASPFSLFRHGDALYPACAPSAKKWLYPPQQKSVSADKNQESSLPEVGAMEAIHDNGTFMDTSKLLKRADPELAMTNVIINTTTKEQAEISRQMRASATGVGMRLDVTA